MQHNGIAVVVDGCLVDEGDGLLVEKEGLFVAGMSGVIVGRLLPVAAAQFRVDVLHDFASNGEDVAGEGGFLRLFSLHIQMVHIDRQCDDGCDQCNHPENHEKDTTFLHLSRKACKDTINFHSENHTFKQEIELYISSKFLYLKLFFIFAATFDGIFLL